MADPEWTDAEFEVVEESPRRRGWWFDWRNFLLVGGLSALMGLARLLQMP